MDWRNALARVPMPDKTNVAQSATRDAFRYANWQKHRLDPRYNRTYPFADDYAELDGQRFTREQVFADFNRSLDKGIISSIKWGYPTGGKPGGGWMAFSEAFRCPTFGKAIQAFRKTRSSSAHMLVSSLNSLVSGVGTATTSKIAHFAGLMVVGGGQELRCLIYDSMVRRAIKRLKIPEFEQLKSTLAIRKADIPPAIQELTYGSYLVAVEAFARCHSVEVDQVELWLFKVGRLMRPDGQFKD